MHTSFDPAKFGTGRWEGGQATITNPHFEYRDADFGNGPERLVTLFITYLDRDGGEHPARFDVGNTMTRAGDQILVIRDSADDDAGEAEIGPSFSHIDSDKVYNPSAKSEFGIFMTTLMTLAGFSASKLEAGDIGVLDGLEVIVTPKAKKEGDKWPLLCVTELVDKRKATKPTTKPAATAASKAAPKKAPAAVDEPEEEVASDDDDPVADAARALCIELVAESDGPVKIGKIVTSAMTKLKGDKKLSAAVVGLVQKAEFHEANSGYWTYDKKAKQIQAVE